MKQDGCPKCGSLERTHGKIFQPATMNDIRFKSDEASAFSIKKHVAALACSKCGYIELYLADEIERP
jgi:predicted nucleic-acid-binding Zn-ribbon protein